MKSHQNPPQVLNRVIIVPHLSPMQLDRYIYIYGGWYFEFRLSIKLGVDTVNFIAKKDDSHFTSTTSFDQHHLQFSF